MTVKYISPADDPASARLRPQPQLHQRLLVVEDDPLSRRLNTEVLARAGYEVDAEADEAAAWHALQLNNYDLMITDNHRPKLSGVKLLKKIHATRMALPVILATGALPTGKVAQRTWLQSATVLLKPYDYGELLDLVKNVLHATSYVRAETAPAATALRP